MNIKDFTWVEKRFGTRFATILKGIKDIAEEGGQKIASHFINSKTGEVTFKDLDNNNHVLITTEALKNKDSPVKESFDESVVSLLAENGLIEVKWQELKNKHDNGQLIPGTLYRITDYQCTTTQVDTQSAGHQFDIVLLALSENKLAEEGWAMMNESNIYDVTFNDGVTKKCYWYPINESYANLVDVETLIGVSGVEVSGSEVHIDEINKTIDTSNIESGYASTELTEEDLTYNYFQNSNLSAWKVWYCLDNDTTRFAWVDPNGRGVIYRLIDEWNNDCLYDFKNIQFERPMTDGEYDPDNGTNIWVYTFNGWDEENSVIIDNSLAFEAANNNFIGVPLPDTFALPDVVCLNNAVSNSISESSSNTIIGYNIRLCGCDSLVVVADNSTFINCYNDTIGDGTQDPAIYINNKKVLTEE